MQMGPVINAESGDWLSMMTRVIFSIECPRLCTLIVLPKIAHKSALQPVELRAVHFVFCQLPTD